MSVLNNSIIIIHMSFIIKYEGDYKFKITDIILKDSTKKDFIFRDNRKANKFEGGKI